MGWSGRGGRRRRPARRPPPAHPSPTPPSHRLGLDQIKQLCHARRGKGDAAKAERVQTGPERPHVGRAPSIDGSGHRHFGGQEGRGPVAAVENVVHAVVGVDEGGRGGERRAGRGRANNGGRPARSNPPSRPVHELGTPKVAQLNHSPGRHEHVLGFDVAVHDTVGVKVGQPRHHAPKVGPPRRLWQAPAPLQVPSTQHGAAFCIVHNQQHAAARSVGYHLPQRDHVGMPQAAPDRDLARDVGRAASGGGARGGGGPGGSGFYDLGGVKSLREGSGWVGGDGSRLRNGWGAKQGHGGPTTRPAVTRRPPPPTHRHPSPGPGCP